MVSSKTPKTSKTPKISKTPNIPKKHLSKSNKYNKVVSNCLKSCVLNNGKNNSYKNNFL